MVDESSKDVRRDAENYLYGCWAQDADNREAIERELREVLSNHAQAVMFSILRRSDSDLLTEAVDKVILNLPSFRGESMFTTWAHRIMMGVMYDERRGERRRKEVSIDALALDFAGDSSPGIVDIRLTVHSILTPKEEKLFEEFIVLGSTQQEVADKYGIPRATLVRKWESITRKLRDAFGK